MTISRPTGLALESIAEVDPVLWEAMLGERRRQHDKIELIASENYVSAAVMEAQGSWLTNKYAEGLPGKRYYGGCEYVDVAERLAQERALALFPGAEHVNVQPHSGAQANMAAYFSVLEPGDRIMGMNLAHGGHLTHGMALNFSGRLYEVHAYGVRQDTERIDYDAMEAQAREVRPKLIVGGASRLSAAVGLRADGRDRPRRRGAPVHRHGPRRRARRGRRPPEPVPARRPRHDHDPQDAARAARRADLRPRGRCRPASTPADFPAVKRLGGWRARRVDRPERLPGHPGRPADARHRRQGRRVQARRRGDLPRGPAPDRRERPGPGRDARRPRRAGRLGRHGQPPHARRRDPARRDRQGGRAPPRRDRDHRQQERDPVRHAAARTPRRASGSARRPRRRAGFGPDEMRADRPDHHRGDPAPRRRRPPRPASPARSARSSSRSPSPGCRPRDSPERRPAITRATAR